MNAHYKVFITSLIDLAKIISVTFCLFFIVITHSNAHAVPCFDDPQRAYEYLLTQEHAKVQARDYATVNINRASEGELVSLHGIGSSKAQAIILYRDMFGDFQTIDELTKVKGIGAKTVDKNRQRLRVQD